MRDPGKHDSCTNYGTRAEDRLLLDLTAHQNRAELSSIKEQLLRSALQTIQASWPQVLASPVRAFMRLYRPQSCAPADLLSWQNIFPAYVGGRGWSESLGSSSFYLSRAQFGAGLVHFALEMETSVKGQFELSFADEHGTLGATVLTAQADKRTTYTGVVALSRPAIGLRFTPLNTPGFFRLVEFSITQKPSLVRWFRGLARMLRSERMARCLQEAQGLLQQGRLRELVYRARVELNRHCAGPNDVAARLPNDAAAVRVSPQRMSTTRPLKIAYVVAAGGMCGGVRIIMEHASRLAARGHDVEILCGGGDLACYGKRVPVKTFNTEAELRRALAAYRGIKVATWNETAPWVAESLQPGDRGYYLIQDIEDSYCTSAYAADKVLRTYKLGLRPITEGLWVREQLKSRLGLDSAYVGIGIDFDVFWPRNVARNAHNILFQARTWSGGTGEAGAQIKGWDTARHMLLECHRLNPDTTATTFSLEERPAFPSTIPHAHYRFPSDSNLAELYSQAGVFVLTSTHEGFGLPAAEAMACGCPVVATCAHGNEEFCIDGVTALTCAPGDVKRLAENCVRLQQDQALAQELSSNAKRFIDNYRWDKVIDRLEQEFASEASHATCSPSSVVQANPDGSTCKVDRPEAAFLPQEYPDLGLQAKAKCDLSIVIPTYNDVDMVRRCIRSCRQHTAPELSTEFIVVDDGTKNHWIRKELLRAAAEMRFTLIQQDKNAGFSATVNRGMAAARGNYLVLCNNDIIFYQEWALPILNVFSRQPETGIVGARLLYPDYTIQHAGVDKIAGAFAWRRFLLNEPGDHPQALRDRETWCVAGALLALPRSVAGVLGGLSLSYGLAFEDFDYCLHCWRMGYGVHYCGSSVAYHIEGATRGGSFEAKKAKPQEWLARENAGALLFRKKWEYIAHLASPGELRRPSSLRAA